MNRDFHFYHGAVLCRVIHSGKTKSIIPYPSNCNASYIINQNIGLYVKYSTKRMSPWRFTFGKEHQSEIEEMAEKLDNMYIVLICHDDGVVCLHYKELKQILDYHYDETEWVSASRRPREKYTIAGKDGKLKGKIGNSDFPLKLFNL